MAPGKTLVLGLGNDLLSDDAIGLRLADALKERLAAHPEFTVSKTAEMGLALLDLVTGFERLVLLDAVQTGKAPVGSIHRFQTGDLNVLPSSSPHFTGVGEMLALGRELGLDVPQSVRILAIEVEDPFTVGTRLTPALEAAFSRLVDEFAARLLADTTAPAAA